MDDWIGMNGGILFNLEKNYLGRKAIFTLRIEKGAKEPDIIGSNSPKVFGTDKMKFVPPDTQPTMGFMKTKTTFKEAYELLSVQFDEYLYLLEPEYYLLLVFGAMSTYFREVFYTYPYFDFYAAEYNCGKTTAMKCLIWASFYGFLPLDPTGPVLFRAIDGCHSAVGIDELDNVIQDETGRSNIIGLLNAAYQKGTPAYRVDMERGGEVIPYDPFGLKAFTHTAPLPDSFRSRSIIIQMYRTPETKEQLRTPEEFRDFRDMMYKLRMKKSEEVDVAYDYVLKNCNMFNRDRDRFAPILTMAYLVNIKLYEQLLKWAKEYTKAEAPSSFDEVVRVLVEVLGILGEGTHSLTTIRKDWNDKLQNREITSKNYGSRTCQKKLESLGFSKSPYRPQNRIHYDITSKRLQEWIRIYNIDVDTLEDNLNNYDNPLIKDGTPKQVQTTDGSTLEHFVDKDNSVIEVTKVIHEKQRITKIQQFLLDYSSGQSFEPSEANKADPKFLLHKAIVEGYVEEIVVGGPYRLTAAGRELIKDIGKVGAKSAFKPLTEEDIIRFLKSGIYTRESLKRYIVTFLYDTSNFDELFDSVLKNNEVRTIKDDLMMVEEYTMKGE